MHRYDTSDFDSKMKTGNCIVSNMGQRDWDAVKEIYEDGIATGNATVETVAPDWRIWNSNHRLDCRLVAREKERRSSAGLHSVLSLLDLPMLEWQKSVYTSQNKSAGQAWASFC